MSVNGEDGAVIPEVGFYGKLPVYGDFIGRRLPRDFVRPWDEWLQMGLAAARERLPDQWLTHYLNCPAWTFVLAAGVCGEAPCAGVTIPSVDRVGRYFNFTLAAILPPDTRPVALLIDHGDWLAELEDLAITILDEDLDQDRIDAALARTRPPALEPARRRPAFDTGPEHLRVVFHEPGGIRRPVGALAHEFLRASHEAGYGLWLQRGSEQVSPQALCAWGLPATDLFLDFLFHADAVDPPPSEDDAIDRLLARD